MTAADRADLYVELLAVLEVAVYVWELDDRAEPADLRLVYANPATATMTGTSAGSMVGRTMSEVFPRSAGDERARALVEVAQGAPARELGDTEYETEELGVRTYGIRLLPVSHGRVAVVCTDVTRQRAAEASALDILDSMSDLFSAFDHELRYLFINAEGERIAGRSRDQMIGQRLADVYPGVESTKMYDVFLQAVEERQTAVLEEYFEPFEQWVAFRIYPTSDGIAVYAQDITARKRLDEQVIQAQKMRAVATLAGGIAHDFNNALTAIRAAAQLGLAEGGEDVMRRDLERIDLVAERATSLTQQMLTISRAGPSVIAPTSVDAVILSMSELVAQVVGESVDVSMDLGAPDDVVLIGEDSVQQVLLNLCLNARDAMPAGGGLRIRTATEHLDATQALGLDDVEPGRYVVLKVVDTGSGMTEDVARRALEPFFTTKEAGTGLGLASVFGTIRHCGGYLTLGSEPGAGTTVTIWLPVADLDAAPGQPSPERLPAGDRPETVLVAEDDEQVRPLVVRALERAGYQVLQASGGEEALEVAAHFAGPVDLLLTDVVMPGMGGGELAATLSGKRPGMRVLYMSGYAADVIAQKGIRDSDAGFLPKPFRLEALLEAIRTALATAAVPGARPR